MFLNSTVQKSSSILKLLHNFPPNIDPLLIPRLRARGWLCVALATFPLFVSLKCHWLAEGDLSVC